MRTRVQVASKCACWASLAGIAFRGLNISRQLGSRPPKIGGVHRQIIGSAHAQRERQRQLEPDRLAGLPGDSPPARAGKVQVSIEGSAAHRNGTRMRILRAIVVVEVAD